MSLVLATGGYLFWLNRLQARLGHLELTTDSPNLLAEVVDADGHAISATFPVPTPQPVALPAGVHQLRLSASGLLSETWPIEIARGQTESHSVQLNPRWLWPPGEVNLAEYPETEVVALGTHADLLTLTHAPGGNPNASIPRRLRLLDGSTGKPAWPADLVFDETSLPAGGDLGEWQALLRPDGLESTLKEGGVAGRVRDLDGDGLGDPVLLSRTTPSLLAVSGATGRVLWWARVRPALDQAVAGQSLPTNGLKLDRSGSGFVVGLPAVGDVDADGTPDFVACFRSAGDTYVAPDRAQARTGARSLLAAISGKTGAVLWQVRVDEDWSRYLHSSTDAEKYRPLCRPALARVNGRDVVVLVEKARLLGVDARTGEAAWPPLALGFEPDHAPDMADLDGDGESEALLLRVRENVDTTGAPPLARTKSGFSEEASLCLVALSLPEGEIRWEKSFSVAPKWQSHALKDRRRQFHQIADLDDDGRPEAILSSGGRTRRGGTRLGFEVLDGRTGSSRWHRLMWAHEYFGGAWNVDQFIVGPDLDGDGHGELFAAWGDYDEASRQYGLSAAALSGATGAMLWRTHEPGAGEASALAWWHAGADGWPLLLVSAKRAKGGQDLTLVLAAGSGRLEHMLPDVRETRVADFDGDGIQDLFYTVSPRGERRNLVVKGRSPDAWRQLGDWRPAADFDGDGFTDLIGIAGGVLTTRSGGDGRTLWQTRKGSHDSPMESPQPVGDFDGDGVPDVLATVNVWRETGPRIRSTKRLPAAFSGKDGRQLWTVEELDILGGSAGMSGSSWSYRYPLLDWADLDQDGRAELLAVHPRLGGPAQISSVSGRDGHMLWTVPITLGGFAPKPSPAGQPLTDFNGDHVLDLALWMPSKPADSELGPLELNVVNGRTGQTLWPAPAVTVHHPQRLVWPEAVVADLDRDGSPEALALRHDGYDQRTGLYRCELLAVEGREGAVRWTWSWEAGFPELWPPVFLKSPTAGPPLVCLVIQTSGVSTLVALDANGQERTRKTLNLPGTQFDSGRFVWRTADVNGDGRDELLFLDDGRLCAAAGEALEVQWRSTLPDDAVRLVNVRAPAPGFPPTLTVWSGREVRGIEGSSGSLLWRCDVADRPRGGGSEIPEVCRLDTPAPVLPHVQCFTPSQHPTAPVSVVRQAWPVSTTGRYMAPRPTPQTYLPIQEVAVPQQRLPWAQEDTILIFSGAVTLLVAGIPGLLVWWAIRRRSWLPGLLPVCYAGLCLLLPGCATMPAVLVLGYAGWMGLWAVRLRKWAILAVACVHAGLSVGVLLGSLAADPPTVGLAWVRPLQMALAGLPGLAFWAMCGWALKKRHWARLGWLLGGSALAAFLAAAPMLWNDVQYRLPEETYSWRGAYFIWFIGITLAGLVGLIILAGKKVAQWIRRHHSGKKPTATAAQT